MTDFEFTYDSDEPTRDDTAESDEGFSLIETAEIPDAPPKRVTVTMRSTDLKFTESVGEARAKSYEDGRTTDAVAGSQTTSSAHVVGASGEQAFIHAYDATPLDERISAKGDGGIDCYIEEDGVEVSVDVKTVDSPYVSRDDDMWIQQKILPGKEYPADIYVAVYRVDESTFDICGWCRSEDLIRESNIEDSPGNQSHKNYTLRPSDSGYHPVPAPSVESECVVTTW